jgi:predicted nuclease of predicted toxin-antitoxin system
LSDGFLVDAELPPALARYINQKGHRGEHVVDIGSHAAPDRELWSLAGRNSAVLVTRTKISFCVLSRLTARQSFGSESAMRRPKPY